MLVAIGRLYGSVGETANENRILEQAYTRSRTIPDASVRAKAACALAGSVVRIGDFPRARQLLREGLEILPTQPQYALARVFCHMWGAGVQNWAGDSKAAIAHMQTARTLASESGVASDLLQLKLTMDMAEAYRNGGRNREADPVFREAYDAPGGPRARGHRAGGNVAQQLGPRPLCAWTATRSRAHVPARRSRSVAQMARGAVSSPSSGTTWPARCSISGVCLKRSPSRSARMPGPYAKATRS